MSKRKFTSEGRAITVVIADREPLFLSGMRAELDRARGLRVVAEVCDSPTLLQRLLALEPQVVVTGFVLSCSRDALGLVSAIRGASPASKIVVILPSSLWSLAERLGSLGVAGLVSREASVEVFREAVQSASQGENYIYSNIVARHPRPDSSAGAVAIHKLSDREVEIFRLIGSHRTYKEIAALLQISHRTVETHRFHIKTKLAITSAKSLFLVARAYVLWEFTGIDYVI